MKHKITLYLLLLFILSITPLSAEALYTITDLGVLGGTYSTAEAISENGIIGGHSGVNEYNDSRAFRWTSGSMVNLGSLYDHRFSLGHGINDKGEVVGTSYPEGLSPPTYGFLHLPEPAYNLPAGIHDLGNLGMAYTEARDINNYGIVVGNSRVNEGSIEAFLWYEGYMYSLGTLGSAYSAAYAVNDNGVIVGESTQRPGFLKGFRWVEGTMNLLESLKGVDGLSVAQGVNELGDAVGFSSSPSNWIRAVLWPMDSGQPIELGTLGCIYCANHAYGINDQRVVVGQAQTAAGAYHAFIWENGTMRDLNTLITPGTGWVLEFAHDVNNQGQIVGFGTRNGQTRAFLLTPQ